MNSQSGWEEMTLLALGIISVYRSKKSPAIILVIWLHSYMILGGGGPS